MANLTAELKKFFGQKVQKSFVGMVLPCTKKNATKVRVKYLKLDTYLTAYFNDTFEVHAYDPEKVCKTGDLVLIKELESPKTLLITHELLKVLYPLGDLTCPLTGRKVTRTRYNMPKYRSTLEETYKLYGENPNRFKYEEAPPRGRLESIQDFTDKKIYVKYYEDGKDQPHSIDL